MINLKMELLKIQEDNLLQILYNVKKITDDKQRIAALEHSIEEVRCCLVDIIADSYIKALHVKK